MPACPDRVAQAFLRDLRIHPSDSARVAQVYRRSCSRIGGSPARAACSVQVRENPLRVQRTRRRT